MSLGATVTGAHHQNYVFKACTECLPPCLALAVVRGSNIGPDLPQEPNSFVGREHELGELRGLVPATRLLTLTGPGGIGKTRLALRLLTAMAPEFPDGTALV